MALCALSCAFLSAQEKEIDWRLAEVPAEVIVNPTGELAKPRPYQGTPSSVVSKSGKRLFVSWYGNGGDEGPDNYVMVAYGDKDLGRFSDVKIVIRSPHIGIVRCFDSAVWRDPNGRVYISWCQTTGAHVFGKLLSHKWNRRGSTWMIYTDNPDDENPTWSKPQYLFPGVMLNKPAYLKNGDILYPVVVFQMRAINDALSREEGLWLYRSQDGGKTIEKYNQIFIAAHGLETAVLEKKNGDLWFLSRVEPYVKYLKYNRPTKSFVRKGVVTDGIYEAVSKDGGESFTPLRPSKIPHVGSRFHISRLNSGALLLVKNWANDERWLAGKPKANDDEGDKEINELPRARKKLIAYISDDDGKTWKGGLVLDDRRHVAYPDASQSEDGSIYITWDFQRYSDAEIYAAKLTEADIRAKKIVTEASALRTVVSRGGK